MGWFFTLWDLYETILAAGDSPYRLHHGWYGLALILIGYLLTLYKKKSKKKT